MRLRAAVPSMVAAVALALAVALVVPGGTAEAMEASQQVVQTFSPGTSDVSGTPVVPPSVITDPQNGSLNYVGNMTGSIMWNGDGTVSQSIMNTAYPGLTGNGQVTHTGQGFATIQPLCLFVVTVDSGPWPGLSVPFHLQVSVSARGASVGQTLGGCQGYTLPISVLCYDTSGVSGSATFKYASWNLTYSTANTFKPCQTIQSAAATGATYVPIFFRVDPTGASDSSVGTDGGWWVDPTYSDVLGASLKIKTTKTCQTATGQTTVSTMGVPGTGVAKDVACPAGSFTIAQRLDVIGPDGSTLLNLSNETLASNALTQFADCLGAGLLCDLSVWVDGVRCALLLVGCDKFADPASVDPSRVQCKWGNYVMPASDCAPLTNCYGVPIDSINNGVAGSPTGCGTDPGGLWNGPLTPIQDGKIKKPDGGATNEPSPTADPTDDSGGGASSDPSSDPTIKVTVNPTINVTVNPTINVNVPQPTVNVTVINNGPGDSTIPQGQEGSDCWPTGTAKYNPLDWAYTPMHCALSKMFMPTPGKAEALLNGIGQDQPFKAWTDALSGMAGAFNVSAGGCQGPAVALGAPLNMTIYPASACNEPQATIAHISRAGTGAVLIIGGLWSAIAAILQGIGYSVRPGGGDE